MEKFTQSKRGGGTAAYQKLGSKKERMVKLISRGAIREAKVSKLSK